MMKGIIVAAVAFVCLLRWSTNEWNSDSANSSTMTRQLGLSKLENLVARVNVSSRTAFWRRIDEKPLQPNLIYEETFEGPSPLASAVSLQTNTEHGFRVVTDPVYKGAKSARFELRASDPMIHRGKRSELFVIDRITHKERWYSFAVFFPENGYAPDSSNELISQWHQEGSPPISLRTVNNIFYLRVLHNLRDDKWKVMELAPLTKGVWHEFVFHIIHSAGEDALIEVWHNDQKLLKYKGRNHFSDKKMPYWKIGVYKAKWNHNLTASDKRVVYFDNIRVGNEKASYADMRPTGKAGMSKTDL
jgi:hypothetical protein